MTSCHFNDDNDHNTFQIASSAGISRESGGLEKPPLEFFFRTTHSQAKPPEMPAEEATFQTYFF
jgi:hypothetical protein